MLGEGSVISDKTENLLPQSNKQSVTWVLSMLHVKCLNMVKEYVLHSFFILQNTRPLLDVFVEESWMIC